MLFKANTQPHLITNETNDNPNRNNLLVTLLKKSVTTVATFLILTSVLSLLPSSIVSPVVSGIKSGNTINTYAEGNTYAKCIDGSRQVAFTDNRKYNFCIDNNLWKISVVPTTGKDAKLSITSTKGDVIEFEINFHISWDSHYPVDLCIEANSFQVLPNYLIRKDNKVSRPGSGNNIPNPQTVSKDVCFQDGGDNSSISNHIFKAFGENGIGTHEPFPVGSSNLTEQGFYIVSTKATKVSPNYSDIDQVLSTLCIDEQTCLLRDKFLSGNRDISKYPSLDSSKGGAVSDTTSSSLDEDDKSFILDETCWPLEDKSALATTLEQVDTCYKEGKQETKSIPVSYQEIKDGMGTSLNTNVKKIVGYNAPDIGNIFKQLPNTIVDCVMSSSGDAKDKAKNWLKDVGLSVLDAGVEAVPLFGDLYGIVKFATGWGITGAQTCLERTMSLISSGISLVLPVAKFGSKAIKTTIAEATDKVVINVVNNVAKTGIKGALSQVGKKVILAGGVNLLFAGVMGAGETLVTGKFPFEEKKGGDAEAGGNAGSGGNNQDLKLQQARLGDDIVIYPDPDLLEIGYDKGNGNNFLELASGVGAVGGGINVYAGVQTPIRKLTIEAFGYGVAKAAKLIKTADGYASEMKVIITQRKVLLDVFFRENLDGLSYNEAKNLIAKLNKCIKGNKELCFNVHHAIESRFLVRAGKYFNVDKLEKNFKMPTMILEYQEHQRITGYFRALQANLKPGQIPKNYYDDIKDAEQMMALIEAVHVKFGRSDFFEKHLVSIINLDNAKDILKNRPESYQKYFDGFMATLKDMP